MSDTKYNYKISDLSPHLFWDVHASEVEWDKHAKFIIQRTLEYGINKDWICLKSVYGIATIASLASELRTLDDRAMRFISMLSKLPLDQFRCYTTRPSIPRY